MSVIVLAVAVAFAFLAAVFAGRLLMDLGTKAADQYQESMSDAASDNASDAFIFADPQQLFYANAVAAVVFPILIWLLTGDALVTLLVFGITLILPTAIYRSMRRRRLKAFEAQLPDALTMISGGLRAGASLPIAIEALVRDQPAPISQEFDLFLRQQRVGSDFGTALTRMEERVPLPDFVMVASALRISREVGGNLAEILETLSGTLRRKATMEGKIESLTAQGRMQAIVMACLPILLGVLLNYLEPEAMGKLFTTTIGWLCLSFIIVWETLGFFFIRKVVSIDV